MGVPKLRIAACFYALLPLGKTVPYCIIRMDRGFTDAELLGGSPDGGSVFDDVQGEPFCSLLHITLQLATTPCLVLLYTMQG